MPVFFDKIETRCKSVQKVSWLQDQNIEIHSRSAEDGIDPIPAGPLLSGVIHSMRSVLMTATGFQRRTSLRPTPRFWSSCPDAVCQGEVNLT